MGNGRLYSVTVSRINEDINDLPYFTMTAKNVTIEPDGSLLVDGIDGARMLSMGLWDGFEVKVMLASVGAANANRT